MEKNYDNFDWERYTNKYLDLNHIKHKDEAWGHWDTYGKNENRVINTLSNSEDYEKFDWETYVNSYDDLSLVDSKEEAWKHWINHGKFENRFINVLTDSEEYTNFDWESYVSNYNDLSWVDSKEEAWKHWINHGKFENRICDNIFLFDDFKTFGIITVPTATTVDRIKACYFLSDAATGTLTHSQGIALSPKINSDTQYIYGLHGRNTDANDNQI
jgi:hypothetical protein